MTHTPLGTAHRKQTKWRLNLLNASLIFSVKAWKHTWTEHVANNFSGIHYYPRLKRTDCLTDLQFRTQAFLKWSHVIGFAVHDISREFGAFIFHIRESKNKASGAKNPARHMKMAFFLGCLTAEEQGNMQHWNINKHYGISQNTQLSGKLKCHNHLVI